MDLCLVSVHDFKIHIYNTQKLNFEGYWASTGYKTNYRGMRGGVGEGEGGGCSGNDNQVISKVKEEGAILTYQGVQWSSMNEHKRGGGKEMMSLTLT